MKPNGVGGGERAVLLTVRTGMRAFCSDVGHRHGAARPWST